MVQTTGSKSGGPASPVRAAGPRCKWPVSRILSRTIIPLGGVLLRRSSDLPGGFPPSRQAGIGTQVSAPGRHASTAWVGPRIPSLFGLAPCGVYPATAFTDGAVRSYRTFSPLPRAMKPAAVFSLWHWPSLSLDAQIPDVIRHTALRSSDFPLPQHASAAAATARRTCTFDASPFRGVFKHRRGAYRQRVSFSRP